MQQHKISLLASATLYSRARRAHCQSSRDIYFARASPLFDRRSRATAATRDRASVPLDCRKGNPTFVTRSAP